MRMRRANAAAAVRAADCRYEAQRRSLEGRARALGVLVYRHDTLADICKKIRGAAR
jgi:hypothetical protein